MSGSGSPLGESGAQAPGGRGYAELIAYFASRGWTPFPFQLETWSAYLRGESGLVHAPTGMGKSYAVWLGPLAEAIGLRDADSQKPSARATRGRPKREHAEPLRVLWLTPLRALASDTVEALLEPLGPLGLNWTVEKRTGDTSQAVRRRQRERLPSCLVTTPESLSLLLSYADARERLSTLRCVVVDEWHELLGSKRGVQAELGLARLRTFCPALRTWGLSATLGNLDQAARTLVGGSRRGSDVGADAREPRIIRGIAPKRLEIETIIPSDVARFPWAGHLGIKVLDAVVSAIERVSEAAKASEDDGSTAEGGGGITLVFCNTRSQAEIWFQRILEARPHWLGEVAIHHGSLERSVRDRVEDLLRQGRRRVRAPGGASGVAGLRAVVCTSSLDLGVDFAPVDQVIQVGSPRGVARLLQRAGRSGHRPGAVSRVLCAPTNALELVEFAAARDAALSGQVEERAPLRKALDVLVQHLVTVAAGGGFLEDALLEEIRSTAAFADLTHEEWSWALTFVRGGGPALAAYDRYARVRVDPDGMNRVSSDGAARLHRLGIGTITADTALAVQYTGLGKTIGFIEESFITRLRSGDRFVFAGRVLELVRIREMTAFVRRATRRSGTVPKWNGGRMALSNQLADAIFVKLQEASRGEYTTPEMRAAQGLLEVQRRWSELPTRSRLLIETLSTRDGEHSFVFFFAGRLAHEGLGPLLSYRASRRGPVTITSSANDYGVELLASEPLGLTEQDWRTLLSEERMLEDLVECLNASQLARRQFRDIARIAGLIVPTYPGQRRPGRQLQSSSDMFYDVLREFDPGNLLLGQAQREVLDAQLEVRRLREALARARDMELVIRPLERLTPLAFPLWAERLRSTTLSSESWTQRLEKMVVRLEREAG